MPANLWKPIYDIMNYSTSISIFESEKYGQVTGKSQNFEYLENKKRFLEEIKSIFNSF